MTQRKKHNPGCCCLKTYAPGIGFVYETKEGSDEIVELVSYSGVN